MAKADTGKKQIARNRKAFHNFEVLEQIEAGIALQGTEVKSLRQGNVSFNDSYARLKNGEVWLVDLHIAPYSHGNSWTTHKPTRDRKLLLHKREIRKLKDKSERQGLTLVPLDMYFKRGFAKITLGVCRGRKKYDKRHALKEKQDKIAMSRGRRG